MKPRVGLFLYTPRVGGAERYVKDLVHGIDRSRFEPVLVFAAWPALERFIEPERSGVEAVRVRVAELGARLPGEKADRAAPAPASDGDAQPATAAHGTEVAPSALRRVANRAPMYKGIAPRVRAGTRGGFWLRNLSLLRPALAGARLDVLHVINGGYPGATSAQAAIVVAQRLRIPARVMTVCSTAMERAFPVGTEVRIDRAVVAAAHAVVVPGAGPAGALVTRRDFDPDRMVTIPWGVLPPAAGPLPAEARDALGLPRDSLVVGTLANFTGAKGHHLLLEAFTQVAGRFPDAHLVLGGDGPFRAELQGRAEAGHLAGRVSFPGNVADALDFCRALDMFVLASDIEGLPYVVLEAMSLSVPVIATDVGAMAEAVVHGQTGVLVPRRNVDALAAALASLLSDPGRRAAIREATRRHFDSRFDVARMLERHEDLYTRLLTEPA